MICRKHEVGKELLCEKLKAASSVALTTDIWTSRATQAYITVTAHYISIDWKLFACVLETKGFPERHTGQAISEKLTEIAQHFALTEKVTAVVHDQAANMELSLEILNRDLGWESLHCSAHCLQLCLKAGLSISAIDRLIGAARKLVGHFNHSVIAAEELKGRQAQMQIREKKLVQEVATRWNSSFYMLERLLEMRWPVSAVLSDERVTKRSDRCLDLKSEQWTLTEELVKVLSPFEVATTFFSYEENTSLSCVLPILHGLIDGLQKETNPPASDSPIIQLFKQKVTAEIKQRWELDFPDLTSSWVLAPAVDPRFKQLKFLDQESIETVKSELVSRIESFSTPNSPNARASEEEPAEKRKRVEKRAALDILLGPDMNTSTDLSARDELEFYMSERPVARSESPLNWWKGNECRFPRLAKVARSILTLISTKGLCITGLALIVLLNYNNTSICSGFVLLQVHTTRYSC